MPEPRLITPRVQASPRRTAIRTRDIRLRAAYAVFCNRIDIRRGNVLAPLDTKIGIAEIIGQNHDDIWLARLRGKRLDHRRECSGNYETSYLATAEHETPWWKRDSVCWLRQWIDKVRNAKIDRFRLAIELGLHLREQVFRGGIG